MVIVGDRSRTRGGVDRVVAPPLEPRRVRPARLAFAPNRRGVVDALDAMGDGIDDAVDERGGS